MSSYQTIGIIASGGMGQVELAIRSQGAFQRMYAVKRLKPEHRDNEEFRAMFMDEGRIAGLIRHPNVVSVHDVGEDEQGPFLAMDLVEGIDGTAFIRHHRDIGTPVPIQIACRIVYQATLGLSAAHGLVGLGGAPLNLIHRDVSPQNIMLGFDGVTRVTDFGIAKAYGRIAETSTGLLKGKAGYMSPEQLRFEDPDQRSDLFSLGVVLYEMLAGVRLYKGSSAIETARMILSEPAPDIFAVREDVHPALVELIFELLAKDPSERPRTAELVAARLKSIIDELAAEEGSRTLASYMTELFGDAQRQLAVRREELVRRAKDDGHTEIMSAEARASLGLLNADPSAPSRRRRLFLAGGIASVLALIGVFTMAQSEQTRSTPLMPTPERPEESLRVEPAQSIPVDIPSAMQSPEADDRNTPDLVGATDPANMTEIPSEPAAQETSEQSADRANLLPSPMSRRRPRNTMRAAQTPPRTTPMNQASDFAVDF